MKIYTKTGDQGDTGLIGGKRVSKASLRIEAYGTIDELNACLGIATSQLNNQALLSKIQKLQSDLHLVGADLADPKLDSTTPRVTDVHVDALEAWCDALDETLPTLQQFILPGGNVTGAQLHLARTVARRAERRVIELASESVINNAVVRYLNRLSDLLFIMARWINHQESCPEIHPDYA